MATAAARKNGTDSRALRARHSRKTRADSPVEVTKQSLMQQAYDALKLAIITLEYRPGECLVESQLRDKIRLGRTPVHEAVARLALEGMLDIMPRKGIVVRPLSLDEVLTTIEARLIVEPACSRLAAERANASDLAEISAILEAARPKLARRDIRGLMLTDRAYHNAIARAARNPSLEEILRRLHERSLRFWFISLSDPRHLLLVDDEHQQILRALHKHDGAAAERATRQHIEAFREKIKQSI